MRLYHLLIVLFIIPAGIVNAQLKLSLDQAMELGLINNIELKRQSAAVENAGADLRFSSRLPNPGFSYSREDLQSDDVSYNEWTAAGSLPVNFLWDRWSNISSKEKTYDAQKLFLGHTRWTIISEIQKVYCLAANYSELYKELTGAVEQINKLSLSAQQRVNEGDISEYDSRRILLELSRFKILLTETNLHRAKFLNELKLLAGLSSAEQIELDPVNYSFEVPYSEQELIDSALANRSDLEAMRLAVESANSLLVYNKLKSIPQISFSAGYKTQADKLKGTVFQLDFEIPLFNRNQQNVEQTRIELDLSRDQLHYLDARIRTEIAQVYNKYLADKNSYEERSDLRPETLFETAAFSYEQGETSVVEFLDGINAYVDGMILNAEIRGGIIESFFELQKSAAISLTNINNLIR